MAEHELNKIVDDDGEVFNLRDSTKQPVADRVTAWGSTPSDTKYPSEKLVKTALDGKVNIANTSLEAQTTTLLAQVQTMAAAGTHYARFYTKSDGGSANISDKPESGNKGFVCEVVCKRYLNSSDYRYNLTCWVQGSSSPYVATVGSGATGITWTKLSETNHTHGNITSGGALQTNDITIADGDKLVVTDASDSNKVARASLTFDGATTNQMLSKKGDWSDTIAKARAVVDYGATSKAIEIGWSGAAVTSPAYFAVYTDSANGYNKAIKDCSLANVKKAVNGTSKGSSTQPTYIDANGVPTAIDYTIESNVPSGAVFTDTKQNITLATTTKAFITGVSTTPTSTAQALTGLADTGVYLTKTAGELNATQYKVNEHCTMKYNSTKSSLDFTFS